MREDPHPEGSRCSKVRDRQTAPITAGLILPPGPRWGWIERTGPAPSKRRLRPGRREPCGHLPQPPLGA
jgi:hypothetical protein